MSNGVNPRTGTLCSNACIPGYDHGRVQSFSDVEQGSAQNSPQ